VPSSSSHSLAGSYSALGSDSRPITVTTVSTPSSPFAGRRCGPQTSMVSHEHWLKRRRGLCLIISTIEVDDALMGGADITSPPAQPINA